MTKISLVTRRRDKAFDAPTQASQRARERLQAQPTDPSESKDDDPPASPLPKDVNVSMEEGAPTILVEVPVDKIVNLTQTASDYLHDKQEAEITAKVSREKVGEKWELKLQFMPEQSSKMLTAKQLAAMLGVSTETVHAFRKRGIVKGYAVGRAWRYIWAEVVAALEKKKQG